MCTRCESNSEIYYWHVVVHSVSCYERLIGHLTILDLDHIHPYLYHGIRFLAPFLDIRCAAEVEVAEHSSHPSFGPSWLG